MNLIEENKDLLKLYFEYYNDYLMYSTWKIRLKDEIKEISYLIQSKQYMQDNKSQEIVKMKRLTLK